MKTERDRSKKGEEGRVVDIPTLRPEPSGAPRFRWRVESWILPVGAGLLAFGFFAGGLNARDDRLLTQAYDQAFFEQVVWNAGHLGRFASGFTRGSFLGQHFEPLLLVPAGLELAWPDARLLSVINALSLAAAAPAGYLLARALLPGRPWLAASLTAAIPAWTSLQQAVIAEFHTEALALPLALLAGWAGVRRHTISMWVLVALVLAAKEDQAYTVLVLGILVAVTTDRRAGLALVVAAIAWGVLVVLVVMPLLRAGAPSDVANYYAWLPAARPRELFVALANPVGWFAFGSLLVGAAGLPLLRPGWLALAFPPLAVNLLSRHTSQADLRWHYGLLLVVPVLVATLMAARGLTAARRVPAIAFVAPALLLGVVASPFVSPVEPAALGRLRTCTQGLPADAPVAADDPVAAPLAARPVLTPLAGAEPSMYLVIDLVGREPGYVDRAGRAAVIDSLEASARHRLCDDGRFQLWSPAPG